MAEDKVTKLAHTKQLAKETDKRLDALEAAQDRRISLTVPAADWTAVEGGYQAAVTVDGLTALSAVDVLPTDEAVAFLDTTGAYLLRAANNSGSLYLELKAADNSAAITTDVTLQLCRREIKE